MPFYSYIDDRDGKIYDKIQGMNEIHQAFASDGYKLRRIFYNPQTSFNTKIDPLSSRDFVEKTRTKKEKVGDILDRSKELSLRREEIIGKDIIKDKWYKNWQKRRKGKSHPDIQKQKGKEDLAKKGVILED